MNPTKLLPNPENPNRHSAHQIQILAAVIQEQGWRAPITVSKRSGLIVRGHGRLEAAMLMGCDVVPVDEQDYKSEAEELADLLADNRLSELAELDEDDLRRVIERLRGADPEFDVELTGFMENVSSTPQVTDMWSKMRLDPRDRFTVSSRVPASPLRTAR